LRAEAALGEFVADATVDQADRDRLGRVGEEVQRDVVVRRGGAREQRADEPRLELLEETHRHESASR
jgi:hypothetical protein